MRDRTLKLRRWTRRCREDESGQALVELALTIPLLLLLLLGSTELDRIAYSSIEISGAAEAGVQFGVQNGNTWHDHTGIQLAAQSDAANLTGVTTTETYTTKYVCSGSATYSIVTGTCSNVSLTPIAQTTLGATAKVSFDPLIHLPGLSTTFTLYGYAAEHLLNQ